MTEKELLRMLNRKKESNFSKKIVTFVIARNIIFTGVILYLFYLTSSEPTTLIAAFFTFTTAELWSLAFIKKQKEATRRSEFESLEDTRRTEFENIEN